MSTNKDWVCYECRFSTRRSWDSVIRPKCHLCGKECVCIKTANQVPKKNDTKAWKLLQMMEDDDKGKYIAYVKKSAMQMKKKIHKLRKANIDQDGNIEHLVNWVNIREIELSNFHWTANVVEIKLDKSVKKFASKIGNKAECGTYTIHDVDWLLIEGNRMFLARSFVDCQANLLKQKHKIAQFGKVSFEIDQGCVTLSQISVSNRKCISIDNKSWTKIKKILDKAFIEYDEETLFL